MSDFHVYQRYDNLYLLTYKYGEIDIADLHQTHDDVRKSLPVGSYLVTMPDLCEIQKVSLKTLNEIHKRLGEYINELQSKQSETPSNKGIE